MASESVKVMVRVRPMNEKEKAKQCKVIIDVDDKNIGMTLYKPNDSDGTKSFTFDFVFPQTSSQLFIYEQTAFPLVESVVEGYNGTMFAYGQTGCGKTFTMMGDPGDEKMKGIIPRSFSHIVNIINSTQDKQYLVRCSYLEIYNEEVHDLLGKDAKQRMELKESPDKGVFIKDLTMIVVKNVQEMEKFMISGNKLRATGETEMNKDSSRSHSLFTLYIESSQKVNDKELFTAGKLNMVDLAGSERQSKTKSTGDRQKEGSKINLSLSALGNVISALVDGKTTHIPYRDSKLTRLLQDSLGGNTKTIMIAAASPADYNFEETLSTLRYASRAKFIKNQPKINEDPKDTMLKEYAEEIKKLKEMLQNQQSSGNLKNDPGKAAGVKSQQMQQSQLNSLDIEKITKENQHLLGKQKEEFQKKIKAQEEIVEKERKERERMEQMIRELEQKTIQGGRQDDEQLKKFKVMQTKLKNQGKEQDKLRSEKEQKENELVFMEKNYQSLQEEVDVLRNVMKSLRNKYKSALNDIKDINYEQEQAREDLLDTIRTQDKEVKLYTSIIRMLLSYDEISQIKASCEWIEETNEYKAPIFYFKEKTLKFPRLPNGVALDLVEKEKESRELMVKSVQKSYDNQDFSIDFRDQKKKNYQDNPNFDQSQEIKGSTREGKDLTSLRMENTDKKFRNNASFNQDFSNRYQEEKKAPKGMLEPLSNQYIDIPHERVECLQRNNNSNSVPPNGHINKVKPQQLKPLNQTVTIVETNKDDQRKPPRKQRLDKIDQMS